ncbi:hypothetical protein [Scytonema sp. PRP1]|uniref:hypothetical protein n=1 Tax=Scytonema sp. PRP1 TaxID=3120513 RepID=UPI002FD47772
MLDTIAKAPVQAVWGWLCSSLTGIANAPGLITMGLQAIMSVLAAGLVAVAASWFIAVKATEVTVTITATAIKVTASTVSGSSS